MSFCQCTVHLTRCLEVGECTLSIAQDCIQYSRNPVIQTHVLHFSLIIIYPILEGWVFFNFYDINFILKYDMVSYLWQPNDLR